MNGSEINKLNIVYLGLGSNIDPSNNIKSAIDKLSKQFKLKNLSRIWESEPAGSSGPYFLNGVAIIETNLSYVNLKRSLREIEASLGRVRSKNKHAPRPIDIDILIYGNEVIDSEIWTQAYIAVPLAEVFPSLRNSNTGENIQDISKKLIKAFDLHPREDVLD